MSQIKSHKDLDVWKLACELAINIYQLTKMYPKEERFGIIDQMRRAAVSIPSNIAEGYGRWNKKEYVYFCRIAFGSAAELETQILLSKKLCFTDDTKSAVSEQLLDRVQRLLNRLIQSLKS
jgi:four helix bundle protein